nr:uncharacterized protein LOC109173561 [Ipomoea batatas]
MLRKAEGFGCERVTVRSSWCKPPRGWLKVNYAVGVERESCSFFVRDGEGLFCVAGEAGSELIVESDEEGCTGRSWPQELVCKVQKCSIRVNNVAGILADKCAGQNVIYLKVGGLPRALLQLLELEGRPYFVAKPGRDFEWDPGGLTG